MHNNELTLRRHELAIEEKALELKIAEHRRSQFSTPVILALIAAIAGFLGNAFLSSYNAREQRELEERRFTENIRILQLRSQQERIIKFLETGNTEKAAANLNFGIQVGLITDNEIRDSLKKYLENVSPGKGPALPPAFGGGNLDVGSGFSPQTYNYNYITKQAPSK